MIRTTHLLFGLVLIVSGCQPSSKDAETHGHPQSQPPLVERPFAGEYPIKIVCTTAMIAEVAERVGGAQVQVVTLFGAGVDPHTYKPVPGDVTQLQQADVILFNGLHLEGRMGEVFSQMARRKPTFAVAEFLPAERILASGPKSYDPHVWFDVSLWEGTVGIVSQILQAYDPPHAEDYAMRAEIYSAELQELHREVKVDMESIPRGKRVLITSHDAFRYFGRAYDIEVLGVQGISTDAEAGVHEINKMVDLIVERRIPAVFIESSVSDRNMKALLEGCRARGHDVQLGGTLYSDAMGESGTPTGSYIGMIRHNVNVIVKALK